EHHVPGANHKGNEIVAEAAQEQRGQKIDHHDHPMHRHGLIINWRVDEGESTGETELKADQPGKDQRDKPNSERGDRVLNCDNLSVLGKNISLDPAVRMVKLNVWNFWGRDGAGCSMCDIDHRESLLIPFRQTGRRLFPVWFSFRPCCLAFLQACSLLELRL